MTRLQFLVYMSFYVSIDLAVKVNCEETSAVKQFQLYADDSDIFVDNLLTMYCIVSHHEVDGGGGSGIGLH